MLNRFAEARLLVVDDDSSAVARFRTGLTRAGFKFVVTEVDPRQASFVLPEVDPDLIIPGPAHAAPGRFLPWLSLGRPPLVRRTEAAVREAVTTPCGTRTPAKMGSPWSWCW
jgi:hypothetical protein